MNLGAPRARMLIGPEGPCRWRSNGHLRRCRFGIPPHVRPQSPGNAAYLQEPPSTLRWDSSLRLASDAFLDRLQRRAW